MKTKRGQDIVHPVLDQFNHEFHKHYFDCIKSDDRWSTTLRRILSDNIYGKLQGRIILNLREPLKRHDLQDLYYLIMGWINW